MLTVYKYQAQSRRFKDDKTEKGIGLIAFVSAHQTVSGNIVSRRGYRTMTKRRCILEEMNKNYSKRDCVLWLPLRVLPVRPDSLVLKLKRPLSYWTMGLNAIRAIDVARKRVAWLHWKLPYQCSLRMLVWGEFQGSDVSRAAVDNLLLTSRTFKGWEAQLSET